MEDSVPLKERDKYSQNVSVFFLRKGMLEDRNREQLIAYNKNENSIRLWTHLSSLVGTYAPINITFSLVQEGQ